MKLDLQLELSLEKWILLNSIILTNPNIKVLFVWVLNSQFFSVNQIETGHYYTTDKIELNLVNLKQFYSLCTLCNFMLYFEYG